MPRPANSAETHRASIFFIRDPLERWEAFRHPPATEREVAARQAIGPGGRRAGPAPPDTGSNAAMARTSVRPSPKRSNGDAAGRGEARSALPRGFSDVAG